MTFTEYLLAILVSNILLQEVGINSFSFSTLVTKMVFRFS